MTGLTLLKQILLESTYSRHISLEELPDDMQVFIGDLIEEELPHEFPLVRVSLDRIPEVPLNRRDRGPDYALKMNPNETPPIVIADGHFLDGKHRCFAARQKGLREIWAVDLSGMVPDMTLRLNSLGTITKG